MKNKNISSRAAQARRTRDRIFYTAADMISRQGFDNVTVDDICREAKVAKGSFYHYFKSKDDIVIQAYKNFDKVYEDMITQMPAGSNSIDKIISSVVFQAHYAHRSKVEYVRHIYRIQVEAGTAFFISEERTIFKMLCNIIVEGQEKNEIRTDLSAEDLTRLVLTLSRGIIYDWCIHSGSYDIEKIMENSFRLLINSLSVNR